MKQKLLKAKLLSIFIAVTMILMLSMPQTLAVGAAALTDHEGLFLSAIDFDNAENLADELVNGIGNRFTCTYKRDMTVDWIMEKLESYGYDPYIHEFANTTYYNNGYLEIGGDIYTLYGPAYAASTVYKFSNDTFEFAGVTVLSWEATNAAFEIPDGADVDGKLVFVTLGRPATANTNSTAPLAANYYGASLALQNAGAAGVVFQYMQPRYDGNTSYARIGNIATGDAVTIPVGTTLYNETNQIISDLDENTDVSLTLATRNDGKNVVAELPSVSGSEKTVYITSHLDSQLGTPGMNDNGSGVVMELEMARAFKNFEFDYNIVFIFFDNEENGLRGAYAYVADMSDGERVNFVANYNMDMICTAQADCIHFFLNISDTGLQALEGGIGVNDRLINVPAAVEIAKKYDIFNHSYLAAQKIGFDMDYFNICYDTTTDHYAFVRYGNGYYDNKTNMMNAVEYDWRRNEKGTSFEALYHKVGDTFEINYLGIAPDGFPPSSPAPGPGLGRERLELAGNLISLAIYHSANALVSITPSAVVTKLTGNKNMLKINVSEQYVYGAPQVITGAISIDNNAAGTYGVGRYKVYVNTKGNTQIRDCYLAG